MPLRVLMTADTVGGVWTYAIELARALAPHGVRIALATMGAPLRPEQRTEIAPLTHVTVFESRYKLEWMENPWADVYRAGDWLLGLEQEFRPDVVHLNGFAHGALCWRAPVLVVGHSCVLSWWEAVKGEPAPQPQWSRYRDEVTRGLRAAQAVAAPSRALLDSLVRHYGPFPGRSEVVPNARDAALFPAVSASRDALAVSASRDALAVSASRDALAVSASRDAADKEPFILAAGRLWDEAKNIATLSAVAPDLPWPVCVAGENRHPDGGQVQYESVRLLGRLTPAHLAGWLARAAIYVLPARYEPFGLSALEAGLAGCALVLGDISSLREVWGDAALFVPPDDPDALRSALRRLIEDAPLREEMARRARRRALEFTPERMAEGYLGLYRRLLTAPSPFPSPADGRGVPGA